MIIIKTSDPTENYSKSIFQSMINERLMLPFLRTKFVKSHRKSLGAKVMLEYHRAQNKDESIKKRMQLGSKFQSLITYTRL